MTFAFPWLLLMLVLPAGIAAWYFFFRSSQHDLNFQISSTEGFKQKHTPIRVKLRFLPAILRMLAIAIAMVAIARPQSSNSTQDISMKGIDIVVAQDISGSMLAEDFKPNRLDAAKEVGIDFINGRPNDRVGLVAFSGESFTQCPITTQHDILQSQYEALESGMIEDGTAIGDGLATAVNRLRSSEAKSKVIILLTDGVNNRGSVDPVTAAEIAEAFGIRVYTIGVGRQGYAPYPFKTNFGIQYRNVEVQIDEKLLQKIAEMTNGKYFRATNKEKLREIYSEIDKLEKTKVNVKEYKHKKDEFFTFVLIALILLILESTLRFTIFKKLP
ncbi:MAG: VWA domain-containing protein [Bacteroidota bacterium]